MIYLVVTFLFIYYFSLIGAYLIMANNKFPMYQTFLCVVVPILNTYFVIKYWIKHGNN